MSFDPTASSLSTSSLSLSPNYRFELPHKLREAARHGRFVGPTAGHCPGFVQVNLIALPAAYANDFRAFCAHNPTSCPLVEETAPGDPLPRKSAPKADLRTDAPRYRLLGTALPDDSPPDVRAWWRSDAVVFLLGCSFTFEGALSAAGLPVRHVELGRNVPMYRTNVPCRPAGPFAGELVVSMRPVPAERVAEAVAVTGRYPGMHGGPVHVGSPADLGIADLDRPDFGEAVPVQPGEVPVFWACGVTPQIAVKQAGLPWAFAHAPGCMFVTDLPESRFLVPDAVGKVELRT